MGLYEKFGTDPVLEKEEGIVLDFGEGYGKFRIRRAGGANQLFRTRMTAAAKPYQRQLAAGTADEDVMLKIYVGVYVDTVIMDWEDVKDANGKALAFTKKNAQKLFEELPEFFALITDAAESAQNFQREELQELEKNSDSS